MSKAYNPKTGQYEVEREQFDDLAEQWKTWVHEWMGEHDVILPTRAYTELLAAHPEASAPGLSEGWKQAAEWLRDHYQDYSNVGSLVDAMRARASAATTCVACEGSPSAENNPCAVCGSAATVGESNTTDDDAFVWLETEISAVDCRYRGDPSYDHDAYWMRERVLKLVKEAKGIFGKAAQQQAQPECPRCGLTVSPESCDCAEARAVRTKQQAEPGADEREAFVAWWGTLSPQMYARMTPAQFAEAGFVAGQHAAQSGQRAGVADDTARLDWLDEQNRKKNASHGTMYGWGYSVNCNRIALEDHHWPARTVREALDAAMLAAPTQQPSTDQS